MKQTGICPKCQSKDIYSEAKVVDRGHGNAQLELLVAVFKDPAAVFFRGKQTSRVSAWICAECGFIELYADRPEDLRLESPGAS